MNEIEIIDEFHHGQVRIESILPIPILQELEITRKANEHGMLLIKGILDERGLDIIYKISDREPIVIYGENELKDVILFSGVISETNLCVKNNIYYITIKALSWSSILDYEEKQRSFQNKSMSYSDVIRTVFNDYSNSICIYGENATEQNIGELILQYKETDWEFCKRLASHFSTCLIADVLGSIPRIYFGLPKKIVNINNIEKVVIKKDIESYQMALAEGFFVVEEQFLKYYIDAQIYMELGSNVEYDNKKLIVQESHIYLNKGSIFYKYVLADEASLLVKRKRNERIKGVSLLGKVIDSKEQMIKIKLSVDKEQSVEKACWFPYASQTNNLFYCMPEIGTSVSLYFPTSEEADCIAMNAVRRNGGNCSKTSNPKIKYMGNPEGKEFKLGITDIDFLANEDLCMSLDEKKGVTVKSDGNINIFTKQKILMEAKELIKIFSKTGDIVVGAKEESSLYLIGGPNGDTHIKAGSNIIYEGRKKEIFTEKLNSEIAYEEKKFDWGKLVGNVLIGLAAVAAVVAVVATGGAALVAMGAVASATVGAVCIGAAVSGTIAVGMMAASDVINGEVSEWQDYALAGVKGAIEGAVSGAIAGLPALKGLKLVGKMFVEGGVSFVTDGISQTIDILYYGGSYDWKQGLLSFGTGLIMPAVSQGIRVATGNIMDKFGKRMPQWLRDSFCKLCGDPVDVISGNVLYSASDFELPGPIPLEWKRIWCSASRIRGHLGYGTRYNYEMGLEVYEDDNVLAVFLNDGRVCIFPYILVGEEAFSYDSKMALRRKEECYELYDPESRYNYLLYPSSNGYLPYKLTEINNNQGHKIQFDYDERGFLCKITDSVGRELDVTTSVQGCIMQIALRGNDVLVSYDYNKEEDLEVIIDAMGEATRLEYRNHLMTKKVDRNKNAFYWEYDKYEDGARAIRTWGDGEVLSVWIDYHDKESYNSVRTSKKSNPSEYHYNEKMLCTRIVYPDLTEIRENYDNRYQLISRVDEEGRLTSYKYNDRAQLTEISRADSSKLHLLYDSDGRICEVIQPEGNSSKWIYNEDDTLAETVSENGETISYKYNEHKLVEKVIYSDKGEVMLGYDSYLNLSKVTLPDGSFSAWTYDYKGNCLTSTNAMGAVETYTYDKLNRMIKAKLGDGNEITLVYDAYDDIVHAKDKLTEVKFTYTILGSIASRTQGGHKISYEYNSEEQLISITNEKGEKYCFERDVKGNIIKETGYDNLIRSYERDYSGLVTRINRPNNRYTLYSYDKVGQMIRADYHDKSFETFTYNKNGVLIGAENPYTKIRLERDKSGRIIKEWQDEHWIAHNYDDLGNCIQKTSSFGANILTKRNMMGQATHMLAYLDKERILAAKMEYNALGQETKRLFSNGISSNIAYDTVGRPIFQEVSRSSIDGSGNMGGIDNISELSGINRVNQQEMGYFESLRKRSYEWDISYRLKKVTNELTKGVIQYSYDEFSSLASAKESRFATIFRTNDSVGNLYETQDVSDRIYGAGSRLEKSGIDLKEKRNVYQGGFGKLTTKGIEYVYDVEGNLAKKIVPNGDTWEYCYYGNGMLKKIIRPDRSGVNFKYDPFGRRIEKSITSAGSEVTDIETLCIEESKPCVGEARWETIGGVRIRRPKTESVKSHIARNSSNLVSAKEQPKKTEKVFRFLWDGNTLFHEWEEDKEVQVKRKIDYQADYLRKMEEKESDKIKRTAEQGEEAPDSLVTWIFEDDFIPRGKITKAGTYSIISDYLGTPVEAYDDAGNKVWERELDIFGRVKPAGKDSFGRSEPVIGDRDFIPFRFQGQYEDEETGLYYNRFRYYDPEQGQYTQQDPIGLAGGNPTLYGYVGNPLCELDVFGLANDIYDFNQAMNLALEWLEKRGFKAEIAKIGKLGYTRGKPIGMQTVNRKIGFRVEFDETNGAHINVWDGKEKGPHFKFDSDENTVKKIQKHYSCKG